MEQPYLGYSIYRPVALQLLSFAEEEVLGQLADIIFTDKDRAAHAAKHEAQVAREPGPAADNPFDQRKDGTRFWASGAMMLMRDAKGQAVGFVEVTVLDAAATEADRSRAADVVKRQSAAMPRCAATCSTSRGCASGAWPCS